jgi:hypothetical protein
VSVDLTLGTEGRQDIIICAGVVGAVFMYRESPSYLTFIEVLPEEVSNGVKGREEAVCCFWHFSLTLIPLWSCWV